MIVSIVAVHLPQGFSASNNGFEIPLYYMIMLFVLVANGSRYFSVDRLVFDY